MIRVFAVAAVVLAMAAGARAEESLLVPDDDDDRLVADCLAQAERDGSLRASCLGGVAERCMEDSGDDTTVVMTGCYERETAYWDGRLNERYAVLMDRLGEAQATALRDAQRAWIPMRDEICAFEASLWDGGTGAGPAASACYARETGQRALLLDDAVAFVGDR